MLPDTTGNDEELDGFVTSVNTQMASFTLVAAENLSALSNTVVGKPHADSDSTRGRNSRSTSRNPKTIPDSPVPSSM